MQLDPDKISPDLALRRYLVGAYAYEWIPGHTCMSDAEWDRLAKRIKRDWWKIRHPHKHILDRHFLRSAGHISKYDYPLIVVSAAYAACGLKMKLDETQEMLLEIRVGARDDRERLGLPRET